MNIRRLFEPTNALTTIVVGSNIMALVVVFVIVVFFKHLLNWLF